jgi:hypothetical protein
VPTDFLIRHLLVHDQWVAVWSRRGAAIASKPNDESQRFKGLFERFAKLSGDVGELTLQLEKSTPGSELVKPDPSQEATLLKRSKGLVDESEKLIAQVASLRRELALPENRLPSRYFEATRLGDVLATVRDIHRSAVEKVEREEARERDSKIATNINTMAHLQTIVEWIEIFVVSVYAAELCDKLTEDKHEPLIISAAAAFGAAVTAVLVLPTWTKKCLVAIIAA